MKGPSPREQGEFLAARLRAQLEQMGLEQMTTRYIPERDVVRMYWPSPKPTACQEGLDFPATREWADRMLELLHAYALAHSRMMRR